MDTRPIIARLIISDVGEKQEMKTRWIVSHANVQYTQILAFLVSTW